MSVANITSQGNTGRTCTHQAASRKSSNGHQWNETTTECRTHALIPNV